MVLSKAINVVRYPYRKVRSLWLSKKQKWLAKNLEFYKASVVRNEIRGVLLVEMIQEYQWIIKFAACSKVIAENKKLLVEFYDPNWTSRIGWGKRTANPGNFRRRTKLEKLHTSFGGEVLFKASTPYHDQELINRELSGIIGKLKVPSDILSVSFGDVLVGDLLYDTYLRYYNKPTIEEIDDNVVMTIRIGLDIYHTFQDLLSHKKIQGFVTLYTSYIDHGITTRVCLSRGIDVFAIGSYTYVVQKISREFPYHQIDHTLFSPSRALPASKIQEAKKRLTSRFTGVIDHATSYMRRTAFTNAPLDERISALFKLKKRNVVIYAHEFYDSPHINRCLQFADLYWFLQQTLDALKDLGDTTVFVKLHPNGMPGSRDIAMKMVSDFAVDHFHVLDETVSNLHIIELKPTLIATARGTVGIEMSYFGLSTVALYDNLYVNFQFVHSSQTLQEYFEILKGEKQPIIDFDKEKLYSFYYQAFMDKNVEDEDHVLNVLSQLKGDTFNDKYLDFLAQKKFDNRKAELLECYANSLNLKPTF